MKINSVMVMVVAIMMGGYADAATVWNGSSNDLWSVSENWSAGIPGSPEVIVGFDISDSNGVVNLDVPSSGVQKLWFYSDVATNFTFSGEVLTLDSGQANPIVNASDYIQIFNNDVVIDTTGRDWVRPQTGAGVIFNGALTHVGSGSFQFYGGPGVVEFNGKVTTDGGKSLELNGAGSIYRFSNSVDNAIGGLVTLADTAHGELVVNTAPGVVFLDGSRIQVNKNGTLTLNSANVLGDNTGITLGGAVTSCTANFNADEDLGVLNIIGSSCEFTLNLGADVDALAFNDCSGATWNSGVIISNFRSGVISFGVNSGGLSLSQVESITAYNSNGDPVSGIGLDESGFLSTGIETTYTEWTGAFSSSWTDAGNWTAGVPGTDISNVDVLFSDYTANADSITIGTIPSYPRAVLAQDNMATDYVISGGTLTIDDAGDGSDALNNSSSSGHSVTWNNDLVINGVGERRISSIGASSGAAQIFNGMIAANVDKLTLRHGAFEFNDMVSANHIQLDGETLVVFSNAVANSISGNFNFAGFAGAVPEVIVNTPDNVNFYDGFKIQMNYDGKMTFNSANVLGDGTHLTIATGHTLDVTFNEDESLGRIQFPHDDGTLNVTLGTNVNELAFLAMHAVVWSNNVSVVFSNFTPNVVRFGTSDTAISSEQLAAMSAIDPYGVAVSNLDINASGYLIGDISEPPPFIPPEVGTIWIDVVSSNEVAISWNSSNAANYSVDSALMLSPALWENVVTNLSGVEGIMSVTDSVENASGFYRVYSY